MFSLFKSPQPVETVAGTVARIGAFLDGGGNWLTFELHLEGHAGVFLVGAPPSNRPPTSQIHLTRAGDLVEFGLLKPDKNRKARRGLESTFRNLSIPS